MALVLTYYSDVKEGLFQKNVSEVIRQELPAFNGKRVEVRIQELKSTRSIQQNRLYWLYVTMLAKELGYEKDEMHDILNFKFLKKQKVDQETGEIYEYVGSTTKLSKSEFTEMINDLIRWAAETLHIVLPVPGEMMELKFK